MSRKWGAFDSERITEEMKALPTEDYKRLRLAMFNYARDIQVAYRVESYGDGLMMVTDAARGQGRCLFFSVRIENGVELLTALLVYKKESQKAPKRILDLARQRMRDSQ